MRLVKLGLASLNPTVGATASNARRVVRAAREMARDGVTVAAFPEQVVGGYPPEDLVQWQGFVEAQRRGLNRIAEETADLPTVLVAGAVVGVDGGVYNAAAVLHRGELLGLVPKEKLPTYDVFYEARVFSRGAAGLSLDAEGVPLGDYLFRFDFGTIAVEVCEDAWTPSGPMRRRSFSGAELVVNVSASPYRVGVVGTREELLATRSADNEATLAYVSLLGAQDGLVFDGGGYVFQNGRPMLEAPRLEEGWAAVVVDLDRTRRLRRENTTWRTEQEEFRHRHAPVATIASEFPTADRSTLRYPSPGTDTPFLPGADPDPSPRDALLDDLFEVLSLGVADYYRKTGAFRALGVAVSGGRDSLLTLLVAWRARQRLRDGAADRYGSGDRDAAGPPDLRGFYMPSRYSSDDTRAAARSICEELGVPLVEVGIDEAVDRELEATRAMLEGEEPTEVTEENLQARIRAARMWNWANSARALFLQTGDMSEKAVGYTTIGGDLEGGLSVIANVPKTVVVATLERLHERFGFEAIPMTLSTEASPELAEEQTAEGELMPFEVLDTCLHLYASEKLTPEEVASALPDLLPDYGEDRLRAWAGEFARRFRRSIYKWVQAPLSLHVGRIDLERERALQLPVVQSEEWSREK